MSTGKRSKQLSIVLRCFLLFTLINEAQFCSPQPTIPPIRNQRDVYAHFLRPLEEHFLYGEFFSTPMTDAEFDSKPMILFMGQYSTGKTSMIRHLIGKDYAGMHIGQEPTTEKFTAIYGSSDNCEMEGPALSLTSRWPFQTLRSFGNKFLDKFRCTSVDSKMLELVTLIDTPGVLSGEKQHESVRGYDFPKIIQWFASRVDRIVLMFDAFKLDFANEYRDCIKALRGHENKIRIVLNKADSITGEELVRVNGELENSLTKLFVKVPRVYIGSFWGRKKITSDNIRMCEENEKELIRDLKSIAADSDSVKLNSFIKRVHMVKVHAHIINELAAAYRGSWLSSGISKDDLIRDLMKTYKKIQKEQSIPAGDFPDLELMKDKLRQSDFGDFQPMTDDLKYRLEMLGKFSGDDFSRMMKGMGKKSTEL